MIIVGLGSNRDGRWGDPAATLCRAAEVLAGMQSTQILRRSGLYETAGVGPGHPENFVNAVVAMECHCGPEALLRRLKAIERRAGPRSAMKWGPRTLDLDILDYRGRVMNWPVDRKPDGTSAGRLVLPHPLLHLRPFVLAPLSEILPGWRHPVLQHTARELWHGIRGESAGRILGRL